MCYTSWIGSPLGVSEACGIFCIFTSSPDAKVIKNDILQRCETAFQEELPLDVPIEEQLAIL